MSGEFLSRGFLSCHRKRELIKYLANLFLVKGHQKFITSGGFDDPARKDKALMCSQSMKGSKKLWDTLALITRISHKMDF